MFAVALYASDGAFIEYHHEQLFRWISLTVSIPVMLYSAMPFYRGAYRPESAPNQYGCAGQHRTDHCLAIQLVTRLPGSGEVYFDSVSMFAFFLLAGRFLEASMQRPCTQRRWLGQIATAHALMTRVDENGHRERLDVDRLQVGDPLLWQAGEYLAVDAVVVEGEGQISQTL